jgi:DNA repair protein RecO (recombination protein O)
MGQTYKATGINLKSMPLGEADKILTILTREHGLIRAVAPGARKAKARLGGRCELFVVNELLLSKGRSLDRLSQAESIESYPRLSRDLAKLTVGQYWAEVVLHQTPSHDPNAPLFDLLCQRLAHLVDSEPGPAALIHLIYGVMQFLSLAGVAPQVDCCCATGIRVTPEGLGSGRVIFSPAAGGIVLPASEGSTAAEYNTEVDSLGNRQFLPSISTRREPTLRPSFSHRSRTSLTLSASELLLMQQLVLDNDLMTPPALSLSSPGVDTTQWLNIEKALRAYVQYQTERPIRSATLLESCFNPSSASPFTAVSAALP